MSGEHAGRDAFLDGTLAAAEAAAFEQHLQGCAECQAHVQQWRALQQGLALGAAAVHAPPDARQTARLLAAARSAQQRSRVGRPLALAFAMAAAIAVFVWVGRRSSEPQWVLEPLAKNPAVQQLGSDTLGVAPQSMLEVAEASPRRTLLKLKRGTVAARVEHPKGPRDFAIETPLGTVRVVGTEFRVHAEAQLLEVEVVRGEVQVQLPSGAAQAVQAHQRLRFDGTQVSLDPAAASSFPELEVEPAPAPPPEVDAGTVEAPEVPEPPQVPSVHPARDKGWRSRAARGECEAVVREALAAVKGAPRDAEAWLIIGDCRRRSKDAPGAFDAYVQGSQGRGVEAERALLLAASLAQDELGKPDRARVLLESYVARKPESKELHAAALVRLARAHATLGNPAKARTLYEQVVKRFPDTPAAAEAAKALKL